MTFLTHDPTDERTHRKALEVLDILDRWNERSKGHFNQKRQYPRKSYRSVVVALVTQSSTDAMEPLKVVRFHVWSRNLSQGGLGFIFPGQINSREIIVSLDPNETVWMRAEIVRCRQVHDGFWDYGAKFLGRADPPPVVAESP